VHAARGSVAVFDAGAFDAPATRQAADLLGGWERPGRVLVLLHDDETAAGKSFRNIAGANTLPSEHAGIADIIGAASLILSDRALEDITARAVGESVEVAS
jgi:large subunit ribosomal protein L4